MTEESREGTETRGGDTPRDWKHVDVSAGAGAGEGGGAGEDSGGDEGAGGQPTAVQAGEKPAPTGSVLDAGFVMAGSDE